MGLLDRFRQAMGLGADCGHLALARGVEPSSPDGCTQCLESGDRWVNLRICLVCGQVCCCDNSPNRHMTAHFHATGHPVVASFQPGEGWRYCYPHQKMLSDLDRPMRS